MLKLEIQWNGVDEAVERASRFGDDLRLLAPVLFDEWFSPMEAEHFATEGGRAGGWEPLSPEYAQQKADRYGNLPIMQLPDRALLRSLTERGAEGAVIEVSADGISFGSSLIYAGVQDETRPLISPTEADYRAAEALAGREWASFAKAQGLEVL